MKQQFARESDRSGEAQQMVQTAQNARPTDWSPDGKFLYINGTHNEFSNDKDGNPQLYKWAGSRNIGE